MAYGIISIVTYVIFLLWAVITYDQGYFPERKYEVFGEGAVDLAAAMGQAFSIQAFFIPVVKKAPNPQKYTLYVLIAYITGCLAYYYIAFAGSVCTIFLIKQFGTATTSQTHRIHKTRLKTTLLQESGKSI